MASTRDRAAGIPGQAAALADFSNLFKSTVFSLLCTQRCLWSPLLGTGGGLPAVVSPTHGFFFLIVVGDPGAVSWIAGPPICRVVNKLESMLSSPPLPSLGEKLVAGAPLRIQRKTTRAGEAYFLCGAWGQGSAPVYLKLPWKGWCSH